MNYYNEDYYKILEIQYPSSQKEIKNAYHKLAKKEHPDMGGSIEKMQRINRAYDILSNPQKKKEYDDWLMNKTQFDTDSKESKQDFKIIIHVITLEGSIVEKFISSSKLNFSYQKYFDENGELYFYEMRQGSKIITAITYKDDWIKRIPRSNTPTEMSYNPKTILVPIIIFVIAFIIYGIINTNSTDNYTAQSKPTPFATIRPTPFATIRPTLPPAEPLPKTGAIFKYPSDACVAPLEIKTEGYDDNYYIYLEQADGNKYNDMSFFIRGGDTYEFSIPIDIYKIYYCSGKEWYGTKLRFGYETQYSTSDELFEFTHDDEYVYGHTITLYPVVNGNLSTEPIDASQFPE